MLIVDVIDELRTLIKTIFISDRFSFVYKPFALISSTKPFKNEYLWSKKKFNTFKHDQGRYLLWLKTHDCLKVCKKNV